MSDKETLQVYAQKVDDYVDVIKDVAAKDPLLKAFIDDLPPESHVLDLGCGPGHFAAAIADAGHRVTAIDAVPEMVSRAAIHQGVTAVCATFDEIEGEDIYDAIWANFSLLHAPRDAMPRHLAALRTALKPGGIFHIALKTGTDSKRDRLGRFYTYYTDAELSGLVEDSGFTVAGRTTGCDKGLDGTDAEWIALRAHG